MPRTSPALADRIVGIKKKELSRGDVQGSDDAAFGAAVPVALSVALDDMEVAPYRFDELSARVRYNRIIEPCNRQSQACFRGDGQNGE